MTRGGKGYPRGLAALQFFALDGPQQWLGWLQRPPAPLPAFFDDDGREDRACDYFMGVACVFVTYANALREVLPAAVEDGSLEDFAHRLKVLMHWCERHEWSGEAVQHAHVWQQLRVQARQALAELGEALPAEPPCFDIDELINADDFRTTADARRLLA